MDIKALVGRTLRSVTINDVRDEIVFECEDGHKFRMHHYQDCCESVRIEDVCGDIANIVGTPILIAEEATSEGKNYEDSCTWTFYKLATANGYVDIRWLGESNVYYSESVDFEELNA